VDATAARVLTLFGDKLQSESGTIETFSVDAGTLELVRSHERIRLHLPEAEILAVYRDCVCDDPRVSDEENAAALMLIHLDESLATREPHESGWWSYREGFFHPLPPWEARRRG
jgi:hypothetical protein